MGITIDKNEGTASQSKGSYDIINTHFVCIVVLRAVVTSSPCDDDAGDSGGEVED